jgi:hypothetical protein
LPKFDRIPTTKPGFLPLVAKFGFGDRSIALVGSGFRIALPVVAFHTWEGHILEGVGVAPSIPILFDPESTRSGTDRQMISALELARFI